MLGKPRNAGNFSRLFKGRTFFRPHLSSGDPGVKSNLVFQCIFAEVLFYCMLTGYFQVSFTYYYTVFQWFDAADWATRRASRLQKNSATAISKEASRMLNNSKKYRLLNKNIKYKQ